MKVNILTKGFLAPNARGWLYSIIKHKPRLSEMGIDLSFYLENSEEVKFCDVVIVESKFIRDYWINWSKDRENVSLKEVLGARRYWSLLNYTKVMLGNSSSGMLEGPSAGANVINVGDRQFGRLRNSRIRDVGVNSAEITKLLEEAIQKDWLLEGEMRDWDFDERLVSQRIIEAIGKWNIDATLRKKFHSI